MPPDDLPPLPFDDAGEEVIEDTIEALPKPTPISLKEFFETVPPGRSVIIADALSQQNNFSPPRYLIKAIDLDLHCDTPVKCGGVRSFEKITNDEFIGSGNQHFSVHVRFRCRNCRQKIKLYSLLVHFDSNVCSIWKLAEVPDFGPPTPAKVFKLIDEEREYYLKGRRSENQGLGIAAFAYYRRAVENQKNRIIDEIIKASRKIGASEEMIAELEAGKKDVRFKESFATVKHGVPQALMVNGHNPLTLLHAALSEALHGHTDEECLERATTIRVVLTDLAERIGLVLKDRTELDAAVTKLMAAKTKNTV